MTVIDLQKERQHRQPHLSGRAKCQACKHEWIAVCLVSAMSEGALECPECHCFQGVYICAPLKGNSVWVCKCGNDTFRLSPTDGWYCSYCGAEGCIEG